jgi:hypothetical protein
VGVLKRLRTEGAASQGVAPFLCAGWPGNVTSFRPFNGRNLQDWSMKMGRNVTLSIGALILIIIVVAVIF